jgi:hypothetical protein
MELSQTAQILHALERAKNGVANHELAHISLRYGARLNDLRRQGYNIICIRQFIKGKATGTYKYYLGEKA